MTGITYLPLRAIGQLMGSTVAWDASTNTVTLTTNTATNSGSLVTDADSFSQDVQKNTPSQSSQNKLDGTMLSADSAKARALAHAGLDASQVTIVKQKLDREDGSQIYKIEVFIPAINRPMNMKLTLTPALLLASIMLQKIKRQLHPSRTKMVTSEKMKCRVLHWPRYLAQQTNISQS